MDGKQINHYSGILFYLSSLKSQLHLHIEDKEIKNNNNKTVCRDKEDQVEEKREVKEKESQTELDTCVCKEESLSYKVHLEENKIICIWKRADCSADEWEDYEEKVDSEMEMSELLKDLGKVREAAQRLNK